MAPRKWVTYEVQWEDRARPEMGGNCFYATPRSEAEAVALAEQSNAESSGLYHRYFPVAITHTERVIG